MSLKQLLQDHRADILAAFVRESERNDLPSLGLSRSILLDHLPVFLDEISEELSKRGARESRDAVEVVAKAREHGEQRWTTGYDLEAVVREYGVLSHAIVETAAAAGTPLDIEEFDTLSTYLNVGVTSAVSEYVRSREEQLTHRQADLLFLSEAGELLGSCCPSAS
jgi:hypothetical protein